MKTPLAPNVSFTVGAFQTSNDVVQTVAGYPGGPTDVGVWNAAQIDPKFRQSIVGTIDVLYRYVMDRFGLLEVVGDFTMVRAELGETEANVQVNGTAAADEVRLYIGADVTDTLAFTNAVTILRESFLEASMGN
jgi:hypothetical protein